MKDWVILRMDKADNLWIWAAIACDDMAVEAYSLQAQTLTNACNQQICLIITLIN